MAIGSALQETLLVLDTDVLTAWEYQTPYVLQAIRDYYSRLKQPPALTSITVFEALRGFEKVAVKLGGLDERTQRDRAATEHLIQNCRVLPFDQTAASIAAYIFPRLSQSERNKHREDIFIVATALAHGYGVATRNQRDFELIADHLPHDYPLLRLDVWKP